MIEWYMTRDEIDERLAYVCERLEYINRIRLLRDGYMRSTETEQETNLREQKDRFIAEIQRRSSDNPPPLPQREVENDLFIISGQYTWLDSIKGSGFLGENGEMLLEEAKTIKERIIAEIESLRRSSMEDAGNERQAQLHN